jgi:hypothetical protein
VNGSGRAKGYKGRSFYVVIQCTNNWPNEAFKRAGKVMVHDHIIKNVLGIEYDQTNKNEQRRVCCGGFAYHEKKLKISSW